MEDARARRTSPAQIGPFRVVRRVGAGGMAEAFEAVRTGPGGFEQRVCVKRVLPSYSTDAEFVRLFLREARLAASLSHRNVTRVVDFGEDAGCHYLALELVEGMDLRRLLKRMGDEARLPVQVVALIGMELAEALEHAHTRSGRTGPVVHRDVSPANILVSVGGDVKLTDFGISKALNDSPLTRSEFVRGNVWYIAPEQLEGNRVPDPRSDLFSLGVVLYQCLAGRRPYQGPNDLAAMLALSHGRRVPLREAAPSTPEPMIMIIDRLLAHRPDHRFQTAAALAEALAPLAQVATARRALRELVIEHRQVEADDAEVTPPERQTLDLRQPASRERSGSINGRIATGSSVINANDQPQSSDVARRSSGRRAGPESVDGRARAEARREGSGSIRARWRRYELGPRMWPSMDRARERRRLEGRPLEPSPPIEDHDDTISSMRLPGRSRAWWLALALAAATAVGLASCLAWMLA